MGKTIAEVEVMETGRLAPDVYSLWLRAPKVATEAKAGQFVSLYSDDGGHILPRPISICEIDRKVGRLRLVYRVVGYGTREFAGLVPGDRIRVMGPLGNGFPVDENIRKNRKNAILIGGGIGIPPMLSVLHAIRECQDEENPCSITAVVGYRDRHDFLSDNLYKESDNLLIATDDGSRGTHGTVIDALNENHTTGDVIYACGPTPMLRGVKKWGEEQGIPVWLSLEEKMACGIGACLACVCKSKDTDDHSMVKNKRICCDGPVFSADEVIV